MWDDLYDSKGLKVLFACFSRHIKVSCRRSTQDNLHGGNGLKVLFAYFFLQEKVGQGSIWVRSRGKRLA